MKKRKLLPPGFFGVVFAFKNLSKRAFSLIEILVSLIIISLLVGAFTPVITKKLKSSEITVGNFGAVTSDCDEFSTEGDKCLMCSSASCSLCSSQINTPTGYYVNSSESCAPKACSTKFANCNVCTKDTCILCASGYEYNATTQTCKLPPVSGSKEILVSEGNWTVPDRITEIIVYMIGAGGSGASSSTTEKYAYADIPALSSATGTILEAGTYDFTGVPTPNNYTAPALPTSCKNAGATTWSLSSTGASVAPSVRIPKFPSDTNITITTATACGGGGGDGAPSYSKHTSRPGGSGGYIANKAINLTNKASNITIIVGAGGARGPISSMSTTAAKTAAGGTGGAGLTNGSDGAGCSKSSTSGNCSCGAGGGGGGSTGIVGVDFEVPGGGGSSGTVESTACTSNGGAGGAGGGTNAGLGGKAAKCASGTCTAGKGATGYVAGKNGSVQTTGVTGASGGGGGSGIGADATDKIFDTTTNCSGGNTAASVASGNGNPGKPGAIQMKYSTTKVTNGLYCKYNGPVQGAGGGGAGQSWIGTIKVTPGQKLSFIIGKGGAKQETKGKDGNAGGDTSILINGESVATVKGGQGGSYTDGKGGTGGGFIQANLSNKAIFLNWLGLPSNMDTYGGNGASNGTGGIGGSTYGLLNTCLLGGAGGVSGNHGSDANEKSYGTGGGGGGSGTNLWGYGGKGADGYIYIEWKSE